MPFGQPKRDTRGAYMRYFVGIDVSKEFHVVNVIDEDEKRVLKNFKFLNSKDGFDFFKVKLSIKIHLYLVLKLLVFMEKIYMIFYHQMGIILNY